MCVCVCVCDERGDREEEGRYKSVHVAAVAQLVREERKRLEQIHPKACCPTCLYTHSLTHTHSHWMCVHLLISHSVRSIALSALWGKQSSARGRHCQLL